jgi:nuclear transport factor 2 (NTF2) superfamily protein
MAEDAWNTRDPERVAAAGLTPGACRDRYGYLA